ncbi:MAG: YceI family protein [Armatimonadetes bacterium]|nr:YceI family protein [Armatimonadota bacterium]
MNAKATATTILTLAAGLALAAGRTNYLVDDPYERDVVTITSVAPLETIVTRAQSVKGTVDVDPNNVLDKPAAKFEIDAAKLGTGIALRDEHMRGAGWLAVDKHPKVTLELKAIKSAATTLALRALEPADLDATGDLTLRGVTREVPLRLRVTLIPATDGTAHRLPGDLLRVDADFDILLSDYGIKVPDAALWAVSNRQSVRVWLMASTQRLVPKPEG